MSYELITNVCGYTCLGSVGLGTILSLAQTWFGNSDWEDSFIIRRSWVTLGVLFITSAIGLAVTKLLII